MTISIARMGSQILGRLGYHVYTETDPLKAINFFKANLSVIDVVITDMTMPHLTGDLLAKRNSCHKSGYTHYLMCRFKW